MADTERDMDKLEARAMAATSPDSDEIVAAEMGINQAIEAGVPFAAITLTKVLAHKAHLLFEAGRPQEARQVSAASLDALDKGAKNGDEACAMVLVGMYASGADAGFEDAAEKLNEVVANFPAAGEFLDATRRLKGMFDRTMPDASEAAQPFTRDEN